MLATFSQRKLNQTSGIAVFLDRAEELCPQTTGGQCNPFVTLKIGDKIKKDSESKKKTNNPDWKELIFLQAPFPSQELHVEVYDKQSKNIFSSTTRLLGVTKIDLSQLYNDEKKEFKLNLERAICGTIYLSIECHNFGKQRIVDDYLNIETSPLGGPTENDLPKGEEENDEVDVFTLLGAKKSTKKLPPIIPGQQSAPKLSSESMYGDNSQKEDKIQNESMYGENLSTSVYGDKLSTSQTEKRNSMKEEKSDSFTEKKSVQMESLYNNSTNSNSTSQTNKTKTERTVEEEMMDGDITEVEDNGKDKEARYKEGEKIGKGGMGTVYLAVDSRTNKTVALKKVNIDGGGSLNQALKEITTIQSLRHKHLVQYKDSFVTKDLTKLCLIMDLYKDGDLEHYLESYKKEGKHMAEKDIMIFMKQLTEGVAYLHSKHLVHRDLKPGNIFMQDGHKTCLIGDFGLVKDVNQSMAKTFAGTQKYMGPEYFEEGEEKYFGTEGDIWSLGCVFYEMCILELKNPIYIEIFKNQQESFNKMIIRDVKKHYSQKLADIIVATLQKDPRKRPTGKELLEMIEGTRSPTTSQGRVGENLLKNPTGKDGMDNWKVLTQNGSGWGTEESGSDCPNNVTGMSFATSNDWCTREQMIDLRVCGFTEEFLDNEPEIFVSDWYKGREGSSSSFKISVFLYDSKMIEVGKFVQDNLNTEDKWKEISYVFKNYGPGIRFIKFIDGGKDNNMMKGHYGALITNSSIILKPKTITTPTQKQAMIEKAWTKISYSNSQIIPTERSAFSIVCYNDNYYLFGGHDSKKLFDDLYEFSPSSGKWSLLGSFPNLKRSHHTSFVYKDSMYILGGSRMLGYLKDFHQFDFTEKKWKKLDPLPVEGRRGMSSLIYKDSLYVFGGFNGTKFSNDLLKYDFSKSQWEIIKTSGDISEREACSFVEYKDTFYIFGGLTTDGQSNDLYSFSNGVFTKIISAGLTVKPRAFHSTVILQGKIYIFGGHSPEGWSDDFYVYDIDSNLFNEINNLGACPTKRAGHRMFERNGQMVLCGGYSAPNYYNDMFLCK